MIDYRNATEEVLDYLLACRVNVSFKDGKPRSMGMRSARLSFPFGNENQGGHCEFSWRRHDGVPLSSRLIDAAIRLAGGLDERGVGHTIDTDRLDAMSDTIMRAGL